MKHPLYPPTAAICTSLLVPALATFTYNLLINILLQRKQLCEMPSKKLGIILSIH